MVPVAPAAAAAAEERLRITVPGEPTWVIEYVWSPIVSVAVRGLGSELAEAVQTWGLTETSTESQEGWPDTDQAASDGSAAVTVMFPDPPVADALAPEAFRLTVPREKRRAVKFARLFVLKLASEAMAPNSSSMPTVALWPRPTLAKLGCTSR